MGGSRSLGARDETQSPLALLGLVTLAVASPWAFGSVDPLPRFVLALLAWLVASAAAARYAAQGGFAFPDVPLWPLLALLGLGAFQLLPLPAPVLRLIAPGSAEVWYPAVPEAAALLGSGPRPVSLDPAATAQGLFLAAALVALALLSVPPLVRSDQARRAAVVVVAGGAALAIYGIVARSRFGALLYGQVAVPTVSPFGPFVSKNHFAGYVAPVVFLALGLARGLAARSREAEWTRDRSAPAVVLSLVAALAMALSLFVSHSRGGALAAAGGALVFAALLYSRRARARSLLPAAAVALGLLFALAFTLPDEARARVSSLDGASFRLSTWRDGLRLFSSSPLVGQGFSAFAEAYPRFKQGHGAIRVEHAENEYVELLAEGGLLGLGLALLAFLLPFRRIVSCLPRGDASSRSLVTGGLAGLAALAVHSVVDFNLRIPSNATLAALLAALAAAGAGLRERRVSRTALALASAVLLAGALGLAASNRPLGGESRWTGIRREVGEADRAGSSEARALRVERSRAQLAGMLARRPAFAEGWLLMAALRREEGRSEEAGRLADHAVRLDPSRADLEAVARALRAP